MAFVFFAALDVLFRGWEDGEICFGGRVGEVWEVQNGREDGADGEREEGEDYERQVADRGGDRGGILLLGELGTVLRGLRERSVLIAPRRRSGSTC